MNVPYLFTRERRSVPPMLDSVLPHSRSPLMTRIVWRNPAVGELVMASCAVDARTDALLVLAPCDVIQNHSAVCHPRSAEVESWPGLVARSGIPSAVAAAQ